MVKRLADIAHFRSVPMTSANHHSLTSAVKGLLELPAGYSQKQFRPEGNCRYQLSLTGLITTLRLLFASQAKGKRKLVLRILRQQWAPRPV